MKARRANGVREYTPNKFSPLMQASRSVPCDPAEIVDSCWGRITGLEWCEREVDRLRGKGIVARVQEEHGMVAVV